MRNKYQLTKNPEAKKSAKMASAQPSPVPPKKNFKIELQKYAELHVKTKKLMDEMYEMGKGPIILLPEDSDPSTRHSIVGRKQRNRDVSGPARLCEQDQLAQADRWYRLQASQKGWLDG